MSDAPNNERRWVCVKPARVYPTRICTEAWPHPSIVGCGYVDAAPSPVPIPSQADPILAAALNEERRQSYNAETIRTRPPSPVPPRPDEAKGASIAWELRVATASTGVPNRLAIAAADWIDAHRCPTPEGDVLAELRAARRAVHAAATAIPFVQMTYDTCVSDLYTAVDRLLADRGYS